MSEDPRVGDSQAPNLEQARGQFPGQNEGQGCWQDPEKNRPIVSAGVGVHSGLRRNPSTSPHLQEGWEGEVPTYEVHHV